MMAFIISQMPLTALGNSSLEGGEIVAFILPPDKTTHQTVPLGTTMEDLDLPATHNATVRVAKAADTESHSSDEGLNREPITRTA